MAAAAILKSKNAISPQRFDRSLRNLVRWCKMCLLTSPTVKNLNFTNPRCRTAAILKTVKLPYLCTAARKLVVYKKLSCRLVTARCVLSVVILPVATQQCRNYLYDKSWPNWWYEVGGLVGGNVSWTTCTQPWRDWVGSRCLRCHKQTDDVRIVYITCIPTTCCGEIF